MRNNFFKSLVIIASGLILVYFTNCDNHTDSVSNEESSFGQQSVDGNVLSSLDGLAADGLYHTISGKCNNGSYAGSLIEWQLFDGSNYLRMDSDYALTGHSGAESSCDKGQYTITILSLPHQSFYADNTSYIVDYSKQHRLNVQFYGLDQNGIVVQDSLKEVSTSFSFSQVSQ